MFTGGTLTNSYAESVNNRIRRYKLTFHARSSDKIPLLRNYCKYQAKPVKDSFHPNEDLLKIMDDEVLQKITHGVLATQQKLIKKAKQTCTVIPPSTTAPNVISVKQILAERNQEYLWNFQYNNTSANLCCSCNALEHNGMPCVHIVALALHDNVKYKIPYSYFNKRFNKDTTQTLAEPVEEQAEPEQEHRPCQPKKRIIVPEVDADSQHIVAASINAVYNDENSMKIRGMIQMIELATLKLVEAGMPVKKVMKHLRQIHRQIEDKTITLNRRKNQTGVIPHAKRRNRARSYIAVPLELRQTRQRLEWCHAPPTGDEQKEDKKGNDVT